MKLIVVTTELGEQIDSATPWKGIPNHEPAGTVRYNLDKSEDIKAALELTQEELDAYIVDQSEIVQNEPEA
jgi:hypothetical protein